MITEIVVCDGCNQETVRHEAQAVYDGGGVFVLAFCLGCWEKMAGCQKSG
ncbi:MAG: hypothetical protein FWF59_12790 [Turicibacter sp.]|nr:hypothetical protein [Turicibacter sp.]